MLSQTNGRSLRRHRGVAAIWVIVAMMAMVGICSLAVDLGRVVTAKTELERAASAAARIAVYDMSAGADNATIRSDASAMAASNTVDGTAVSLSTSAASTDIQVGLWNSSSKTFSANATPLTSADDTTTFPAVKIWAKRTKANGNPISLAFGGILGAASCDVHGISIVELYPVGTVSYNGTGVTNQLHTTSDPWLAGVASTDSTTMYLDPPTGYTNTVKGTGSSVDTSYGSSTTDHYWKYEAANAAKYGQTMSSKQFSSDYQTGQPYGSPMQVGSSAGGAVNSISTIPIKPGSILQITSVSQAGSTNVNNDFVKTSNYDATGSNGGTYHMYSNTDDPADAGNGPSGSAENGISNIYAPINSIIGVFMDSNSPLAASEGNVSAGNTTGTAPSALDYSTQSARDYSITQPQLRQSFYVGNGQTSGGDQQTIIVPPNATRMFLGTMDGHEWSNNSGGFNLTISEYQIETVQ
jgi:Flp pilus assembly protein TadG